MYSAPGTHAHINRGGGEGVGRHCRSWSCMVSLITRSDTTEKLESCVRGKRRNNGSRTEGAATTTAGGQTGRRAAVVSDLGWLVCEVIGARSDSPIAKIFDVSSCPSEHSLPVRGASASDLQCGGHERTGGATDVCTRGATRGQSRQRAERGQCAFRRCDVLVGFSRAVAFTRRRAHCGAAGGVGGWAARCVWWHAAKRAALDEGPKKRTAAADRAVCIPASREAAAPVPHALTRGGPRLPAGAMPSRSRGAVRRMLRPVGLS